MLRWAELQQRRSASLDAGSSAALRQMRQISSLPAEGDSSRAPAVRNCSPGAAIVNTAQETFNTSASIIFRRLKAGCCFLTH